MRAFDSWENGQLEKKNSTQKVQKKIPPKKYKITTQPKYKNEFTKLKKKLDNW